MLEPGMTIMIFADPEECTIPLDQACLLEFIQVTGELERWTVEYPDMPGIAFKALINPSKITSPKLS